MENKQYTMEYASPVGQLTVASDGESIIGLWVKGQKYYAAALDGKTCCEPLPVFDRAAEWLGSYFRGENPEMTLPLNPRGSGFRRGVWDILRAIPYGGLTTYGEIAKEMASKAGAASMSAQAVGGAVGHNPISIIIPCHRVVGSNGSLTGYAGGIDVKIKLLELEGAPMDKLFVPRKGTAL